jgi:hypothetical protein
MASIVSAITSLRGACARDNVTYRPDPILQAQFASHPPLECPASLEAGFRHDGSLENLVRRVLEGA